LTFSALGPFGTNSVGGLLVVGDGPPRCTCRPCGRPFRPRPSGVARIRHAEAARSSPVRRRRGTAGREGPSRQASSGAVRLRAPSRTNWSPSPSVARQPLAVILEKTALMHDIGPLGGQPVGGGLMTDAELSATRRAGAWQGCRPGVRARPEDAETHRRCRCRPGCARGAGTPACPG
jgi:hypothetical protein